MEMIALIISGLALLAASGCLYLLGKEKKRNEKQNTDVCNYADACLVEAKNHALNMVSGVYERVEKLEKGIVPDYEKAMAAADAVNSFNQGITNILGFDPKEALIEQRNRERTGDTL